MGWRSDDWGPGHVFYDDDYFIGYEEDADAMLEALKPILDTALNYLIVLRMIGKDNPEMELEPNALGSIMGRIKIILK